MRVVIGEDEALLRAGLSHVLEQGGFDVVAAASDANELIQAVELHRPELLVTDIRMPPSHTDEGLRAALDIRQSHPALPVVVLSQHLQRRYAIELLAQPTAGVGYLLKQRIGDVDAFCDDLRRVHDGASVLDLEVTEVMTHQVPRAGATPPSAALCLCPSGRWCSTRRIFTTNSLYRPATTTTVASWPSSDFSRRDSWPGEAR